MKKDNKHIKLSELENRVHYDVPDGYFDRLPGRIQHSIQSKKTVRGLINTYPTYVKWLPVAIIALLVVVTTWYPSMSDGPQEFNELLADVSREELLEYLYLEDFSTYEIASSIDEQDSLYINTTDNWLEELSDDELMNALNYYDYDTL